MTIANNSERKDKDLSNMPEEPGPTHTTPALELPSNGQTSSGRSSKISGDRAAREASASGEGSQGSELLVGRKRSRLSTTSSCGSRGFSALAKLWMQGSSSAIVAPTHLEASLVRAVSMSTVLRCFAKAFRAQEFAGETHYSKSFETDRVGDFISHDWSSSRVSKLLALCLIYNSVPAVVVSTLASVGFGLLQYGPDPILPTTKPLALESAEVDTKGQRAEYYGYWSMCFSQLVFLLVFLTWQDIRKWLRLGSKNCFVDKFCIDQTNPERKAAGILGLAGFLRCSDRIIILWTPRYFTRLWCTYEVASWLYLKKPLSSVLFLPLAHSNIVMSLMIACWICFVLLVVVAPLLPQYYMFFVILCLHLGLSLGAHQARRCAGHLRAISEQLDTFSVTKANCYCCTVGHQREGATIPCDREVVYTTLAEWFNKAGDDANNIGPEARLDRFDQAVRFQFAGQVLQKAGPTQLPYRYVVVAGWPYMFRLCDVVAGSHVLGQTFIIKYIITYFTICFAATPLWYKLAMHLACFVDARINIPRWRILDCILSLVLGFVYVLVAVVIWLPLEFLATVVDSPLPTALAGLAYLALNSFVYYSDLRECFCKRRQWRRGLALNSFVYSSDLRECFCKRRQWRRGVRNPRASAGRSKTVDAAADPRGREEEIIEVDPEIEEVKEADRMSDFSV